VILGENRKNENGRKSLNQKDEMIVGRSDQNSPRRTRKPLNVHGFRGFESTLTARIESVAYSQRSFSACNRVQAVASRFRFHLLTFRRRSSALRARGLHPAYGGMRPANGAANSGILRFASKTALVCIGSFAKTTSGSWKGSTIEGVR